MTTVRTLAWSSCLAVPIIWFTQNTVSAISPRQLEKVFRHFTGLADEKNPIDIVPPAGRPVDVWENGGVIGILGFLGVLVAISIAVCIASDRVRWSIRRSIWFSLWARRVKVFITHMIGFIFAVLFGLMAAVAVGVLVMGRDDPGPTLLAVGATCGLIAYWGTKRRNRQWASPKP